MSNPKVVRQRATRANFHAEVDNTSLEELCGEFGPVSGRRLCRRIFAFDNHISRLDETHDKREEAAAKKDITPADLAHKTWRLSLRRRDRVLKNAAQEQLLDDQYPVE